MQRNDDFAARRQHLAGMSDEELAERFWTLAFEVARPLVELARTHTSPSIERSVLMRMGFNSLETKAIVEKCVDHHVLGKGAGNVVWRLARAKGLSILEAGRALAEGRYWDEVPGLFAAGGEPR